MAQVLYFTIAKNAPGEDVYSGSVIAREPFKITGGALVDTAGGPVKSFNATVPVYANSSSSLLGFQIGSVTFREGIITDSTNMTISSVYNQDPSRKITIQANGLTATVEVGVWFKGDASWFEGSNDSYCVGNYGPLPTYYVALPAYGLCTKSVKLYNPNTGKKATGQVWDVGPFFDANWCNGDPYWNTGTTPKSITYKGMTRCQVCKPNDSTCTDTRVINGAIIDISKSLRDALGGSGTIPNAQWRFA